MQDRIQEVHVRIETNKKELRDLRKMMKDALVHVPRYEELNEEMKKLREERKSLENEVYAESQGDLDKMDDLKLEIQADSELLADLALNMYLDSQSVEITDEYDNKWVPHFSVKFKKE